MMHKLLALTVGFALIAAGQASAQGARGRSSCDVCHNEIEFLRQNTDSMARARQVFVADTTIANSAHAKLTCASCHPGFMRFPHRAGETKTCASCHPQEGAQWSQGIHAGNGKGNRNGSGAAGAQCVQCHGTHNVRSAASLHVASGMAAMNRNCVGCHQTQKLGLGSPHADKILCSGCHGAHDTQPAENRGSRLWANQQLQTCGTCHEKIAAAWMNNDVHARALLTRRAQDGAGILRRPPACTDCHGAHGMIVSPDSTLEMAASERCMECHTRVAGHYEDSYHGQASQLGSKRAASCADCHTPHTIRQAKDPLSTVASANLQKTCARCHQNATASFTKFDPHVNAHDKSNPLVYWVYKFMNLLLLGTMAFFGMHTALWLIRLGIERRKAGRP